MKVQLKQALAKMYQWTVLEESPKYYIGTREGSIEVRCLSKDEYEPVQEWVPVYTFEVCGMKDKEVRARHSGNGFITIEVK